MFKKILSSVCLAGALALTGASASAATINFDQNGNNGGNIFYGTAGFGLTANSVDFDVAGLPGGNSLECRGCQLRFTTSSLKSSNDYSYTFGGGGPISLSGALYDGENRIDSGNSVLSGYFVGDQTVYKSSERSVTFFGSGQLRGNQGSLFSYYDSIAGTSTAETNNGFAVSIISSNGGDIFNDDGTFSGNVTSSDLSINVSAPVSRDVPEPSDIGLFGLGALLIVGGLALRRRNTALVG